MDEHLTGAWEEFEDWIRKTIGSDFRWRVRLKDTPTNRQMLAELILGTMSRNQGVFPDRDVFIEKL